MKLTIEPTADVVHSPTDLARRWIGKTERGSSVEIFTSFIGLAMDAHPDDVAEFNAGLTPGRSTMLLDMGSGRVMSFLSKEDADAEEQKQ